MESKALFANLNVIGHININELEEEILGLYGVNSVEIADDYMEKKKETTDFLEEVAIKLKRLEDKMALSCPIRDLRQEVEDFLGYDVTNNLVDSHKIS